MHVTCPAELIGRIRVGVRVGVDRALVAFHNAACEGARRPNYIVEGKRCCHCTSSNTKLGFLLPMQAIVGARARSITSNFGAFGASLFVAIATVHSPTCHNPIPVFSPPVPDSMSTHLFSSPLLLFPPPFSFFSFPYRALVTRVWPAAPVTTPKICHSNQRCDVVFTLCRSCWHLPFCGDVRLATYHHHTTVCDGRQHERQVQ